MFTVTIITTNKGYTITEKAGVRGEKTMISIEGPQGVKMNQHPKKIEGWKTREGVENFINNHIKMNYGKVGSLYYEIEKA